MSKKHHNLVSEKKSFISDKILEMNAPKPPSDVEIHISGKRRKKE